jgi:hypothetical protein
VVEEGWMMPEGEVTQNTDEMKDNISQELENKPNKKDNDLSTSGEAEHSG